MFNAAIGINSDNSSIHMARQIKIKDIAKMAGVSSGTVDRVLHNRGSVSESSRKAVERILTEVGYRYNIHTSAVSLTKEFNLVITTPSGIPGEYWGSVMSGIEHALKEFSDINIHFRHALYNQFDVYSCRSAFESVLEMSPDAVIIGPTFASETVRLCNELDKSEVPYVFVDSVIDGTSPVASYTTDQYACGHLLGRLLSSFTPNDAKFAICGTARVGDERSNNTRERKKGFLAYFKETDRSGSVTEIRFSISNPKETEDLILDMVEKNPDIKGIAVLNSRGYVVADILRRHGIDDIRLMSFDLTSNNVRCIQNESISAVLCQRPELQGFFSVKSLIHWLLYRKTDADRYHKMPIDVVFKENLPFYKEIVDSD